MTGIASFPFSPSAAISPAAAATSNPAKLLFSSPFLVRFSKNRVRPLQFRSVRRSAVARYGGGGGYRPSGGSSRRTKRDNRVADSDYDAALDLDLVQSNSIRLLDEQQNMIGVMSKSEAIQMAEDAELLLLGERTRNVLKHLFPVPNPDSKRIITFANRSDYISFRHHVYEKHGGPKSTELKEVGWLEMHITAGSFLIWLESGGTLFPPRPVAMAAPLESFVV